VSLDPLLPAALPAPCHGSRGVSQVPGRTLARLPSLSSDPGGIAAPSPLWRLDAASALATAFGSPDHQLSRLDHAAVALAVYASQCGSPRAHARLATGWWPTFAVRDSHPLGSQWKVSGDCYIIHPPPPGLAWRKAGLDPSGSGDTPSEMAGFESASVDGSLVVAGFDLRGRPRPLTLIQPPSGRRWPSRGGRRWTPRCAAATSPAAPAPVPTASCRRGHQVDRVEPRPQRRGGLVEDRARCRVNVVPTVVAGVGPARFDAVMLPRLFAYLAEDAVRIEMAAQPVQARVVGREHPLEALQYKVLSRLFSYSSLPSGQEYRFRCIPTVEG